MNEQDNRLFRISKVLLPLLAGISITMLIEVIAGDLIFYRPGGLPIGWAGLWFSTTPVTIAMGLSTLVLKSWRVVPFSKRWLVGLGYLFLGFLNFVAVISHATGTRIASDRIWWGAYIYAAFLLGGFVFLVYRVNMKEEIFP